MGIPHWEDDYEAWDRLELGAWTMPGVWSVDFSVRREMDVKKAVSTDGARLKDKGYLPPQLTLVGQMTTRDDWVTLQMIMPNIHPKRKGASREPLRIRHPKTLLVGIDNVFIHEIDAVKIERGVLTVELRAYEWTKQPKPVQKGKDEPTVPVYATYKSQVEPPTSIARYPGMRGIVVVSDDPFGDAVVEEH